MFNFKHAIVTTLMIFITACSSSGINKEQLLSASYSDVEAVNLKVGQQAPNFSLNNSANEKVSLTQILDKKHAMLVFYRGEWCPYCISNLESFESVLPELAKHNVQLVGISPDAVSTNKNTQRSFGQDYLFLSDSDLTVSQLFGIKRDEKIPHPAVFLIKQDGSIAWYHASKNIKVRPSGEQMLEVIKAKL
ncbi:peroxiredoxin family protein [Catenovulum maritimum]|uniref:peroxiredoxin family protein n=1 Tax=Catenovulum maritimum TaxID=1513271 RepID=UPI00066139AF|nr:peroxiredoxin family protein [Catenovulum maritimum]